MIDIFKRWFSRSKEQDIDNSQNPWAGLASYEDPETAERKLKFCGRDDDSYDLARLIMGNVFVTLYGKSGIGKTSLLNAGVFPELREEQYTPVSIRLGMRDEVNPQSYQTMIVEAVERVVARTETINVIDEQQDRQSIDYLWNYFARHRFYDKYYESTTPVIVFDQFEEVFRNYRDEAETLLRQLDYLNDKDHSLDIFEVDAQSYRYEQNFRFIVSIREDDLYRLEDTIDNCFLPALKRCRYRLRSLSEQGARDVILIPGEGLFNLDEKDSIAKAIIKKSRNDDGSISTNIISLLCSRIYVDFKKFGFDHIYSALVEDFINGNPFERFYNEATRGFSNKEKSYIENNFVDSTSRRNSIPESEFLLHVKRGSQLLKGRNRILQRVSTSTAGDNNRIELIHDSFCEPLFNLKMIHEEQRINETSLTLLSLVIIFIIWFISSVFQNSETLTNLISEPLTYDIVTTPTINKFRLLIFGASLINLLIIPLLIYSSVKRLTIIFWLSLYGIISNGLLMYLFVVGHTTEQSLRWSFATMVLLVPTITLFYSIKEHLYSVPPKQEIWIIVKSTPLKYFCLFVSLYLFYLCVFNRVLGLAEPIDSSWAVIVIPLLTHEIIQNTFGQRQNIVEFVVLCSLLGLLTYNTSVVPFALPLYAVICILGMTMGIITWLFWGLTWGKRTIAILLDFIILFFVVVLNMGFNVSKVKYDSVSHVFNWVDVLVHDNENHFGVVSACSGDTILPCAFDSIDYRKHYCFLSSNKISYVKDVSDNKGQYTYKRSTNTAVWKCLFIDEVENNIFKYKSSRLGALREDSIRVYAAKVYHEVRNANIKYFTSGEMYPLSNVKSLDTLVELQNRELTDVLNEFSNSSSSVFSKPLTLSQVITFNKAFARSFYLCVLRDRILQKDSVNLFSLPQEIITLYFYDAGDYELTTNSNSNFNMGAFHKTYSSTIKASDLRNNTLDSWYNYVNMLLMMDMGFNADNFAWVKEKRYSDVLNNVKDISTKSKNDLKRLLQKGSKSNLNDLKNAVDIYFRHKTEIKEQINLIEIEKRQMDLDYQKLINDVFLTLSNVVLNSQNIYDSEFVDICEQLYLISVLRQYEIAPIYLEYLEQMDNAKSPIYREFRRNQEKEDSLKRVIKELYF